MPSSLGAEKKRIQISDIPDPAGYEAYDLTNVAYRAKIFENAIVECRSAANLSFILFLVQFFGMVLPALCKGMAAAIKLTSIERAAMLRCFLHLEGWFI